LKSQTGAGKGIGSGAGNGYIITTTMDRLM